MVELGSDFAKRVPEENEIDDHSVVAWDSLDGAGNSPVVAMHGLADVVRESNKVAS